MMRRIATLVLVAVIVAGCLCATATAACQSSEDCTGQVCGDDGRCQCSDTSYEADGEWSQRASSPICSDTMLTLHPVYYNIHRALLVVINALVVLLALAGGYYLWVCERLTGDTVYNSRIVGTIMLASVLKIGYNSIDPLRAVGTLPPVLDVIWFGIADLLVILPFCALYNHFKEQCLLSPVISDALYNHLVSAHYITHALRLLTSLFVVFRVVAGFFPTILPYYNALLALHVMSTAGLLATKFYHVARDDSAAVRRVSVLATMPAKDIRAILPTMTIPQTINSFAATMSLPRSSMSAQSILQFAQSRSMPRSGSFNATARSSVISAMAVSAPLFPVPAESPSNSNNPRSDTGDRSPPAVDHSPSQRTDRLSIEAPTSVTLPSPPSPLLNGDLIKVPRKPSSRHIIYSNNNPSNSSNPSVTQTARLPSPITRISPPSVTKSLNRQRSTSRVTPTPLVTHCKSTIVMAPGTSQAIRVYSSDRPHLLRYLLWNSAFAIATVVMYAYMASAMMHVDAGISITINLVRGLLLMLWSVVILCTIWPRKREIAKARIKRLKRVSSQQQARQTEESERIEQSQGLNAICKQSSAPSVRRIENVSVQRSAARIDGPVDGPAVTGAPSSSSAVHSWNGSRQGNSSSEVSREDDDDDDDDEESRMRTLAMQSTASAQLFYATAPVNGVNHSQSLTSSPTLMAAQAQFVLPPMLALSPNNPASMLEPAAQMEMMESATVVSARLGPMAFRHSLPQINIAPMLLKQVSSPLGTEPSSPVGCLPHPAPPHSPITVHPLLRAVSASSRAAVASSVETSQLSDTPDISRAITAPCDLDSGNTAAGLNCSRQTSVSFYSPSDTSTISVPPAEHERRRSRADGIQAATVVAAASPRTPKSRNTRHQRIFTPRNPDI